MRRRPAVESEPSLPLRDDRSLFQRLRRSESASRSLPVRKRALVTGGAGYLARAIYRRARNAPEDVGIDFTCLSRDDAKHVSLQARYPEVACLRGDVADDVHYLAAVLAGFDYVIHAAAVKYVDRAEGAAWDTHRVNVIGSANVIKAAIVARVARVVAISTDKAAAPTNTYGMTKALMERLFLEAAQWETGTEFVVCRYGNVVGSTGSALPLFKRQLAEHGEVRVTDPGMTRFWMSPDEAVDCVLDTLMAGPNGTIVVPNPRASTLMTAVHAVVGDMAKVRVVGSRPGEKRHETLIHAQESTRSAGALVTERGGYTIIAGPTAMPGETTFEHRSDDPPGGPITSAELAEILADSETI